jgi:hypothetical protein
MSTIPAATVRCAPARASIRGAIAANTATHSAIGTKARPALTGEKPSVSCR